ncbi:MAG TPA: hypothetical protein VNH18_08185, partial [Bryobacteraceae bacterium]|nr:hypothetical protein [Bryobacteraceae bacterium]
MPLYLQHIDVATYGGWLASSQLLNWITIIDPGTDEVIRQRAAHAFGRLDYLETGKVVGSGITLNSIVALAILIVGIALTFLMSGRFGLHGQAASDVTRALLMMTVASALTTAAYSLGSPLLALQRAFQHGIVYVGGTLAALIITVVLLHAGWGISSIPAGLLARALVWTGGWGLQLYNVTRCTRLLRLEFSLRYAREVRKLTVYTFLAKICAAMQSSVDGVLIGSALGPVSAASYLL